MFDDVASPSEFATTASVLRHDREPCRPRCTAPWQTLMIEGSGVVQPCAYRGNYGNFSDHPPLGNVNEHTIEEIWNGEEVRKLRRLMAAGDLQGAGCGNCLAVKQGLSLQLEYDLASEQETEPFTAYRQNLDLKRAEIARGAEVIESKPLVLYVTPTHKCNLRCTHCYQAPSRSETINRDALQAEVEALLPYLSDIVPGGGEPLILPFWVDLLTNFSDNVNPYLRLATTTSASHVPEGVFEGLSRFRRAQVMVSFDGPDKATFEAIRKNANFETVVANLQRFQRCLERNSENGVVMHISVMKQNILLLPELVRLAAALEVPFNFQPVVAYPVDHSLRCFRTGPVEAEGWGEALDETRKLIETLLVPALVERNARLGKPHPGVLTEHLPLHIDALRALIPYDVLRQEHVRYEGQLDLDRFERLVHDKRDERHDKQSNNEILIIFGRIDGSGRPMEVHHYADVGPDGRYSAVLPKGPYFAALRNRMLPAGFIDPWIIHVE